MSLLRVFHLVWLLALFACALHIGVFGTPWENTLGLAAEKKIDLGVALFYRYRDATIAVDGSFGSPTLPVFLAVLKLSGVRLFWISTVVVQALFLRQCSFGVRLLSLGLLAGGVIWGEAFLVWNFLFTLLVALVRRLVAPRKIASLTVTAGILAGFLFSVQLAWLMGNPARVLKRYRVLGGNSHWDVIRWQRLPKIDLAESCAYAINPDDLHGVQSVELFSRRSLSRLHEVVLVDLKVIEANYRFLHLKDGEGDPLFSAEARAFAEKEKKYAAALHTWLRTIPRLCLVAPFDRLPELEERPFSRAREIVDDRKKSGLGTLVIQLPGN